MTTLDLRLTTLEFQGLLYALHYYTRDAHNRPAWQLTEDELILLRYAKTMTQARVTLWSNRRFGKVGRKRSLVNPARFAYRTDWLLVKVLYRRLTDSGEPTPDFTCLSLLGRLDQALLNPEAFSAGTGQQVDTAGRTGSTGGIVETIHI